MIYERFGNLTLPDNGEHDISTADSRSGLVPLPSGGSFDTYGSTQAPRTSKVIPVRGRIVADDETDLQSQIDAFRAKRGKRDKLYARARDGSVRWTYARILGEPMMVTSDQSKVERDITINFELANPLWYGNRHGDGWTLDSGEYLDTGLVLDEDTGDVHTLVPGSLNEIDVTNDGDATIRNAILKITAGASAITALSLTSINPDLYRQAVFEFTGTIGAGQTLVIDAGAQSATIATALNADAAAGDVGLSVFNSNEFVVGRGVTVAMLDGARILRTTIASVPGSTSLTIDDPLPFDAPGAGAVVMDAYPDLEFGPAHALGGWFVLDPGTTALEIELTSGTNATLTTVFNDGHE